MKFGITFLGKHTIIKMNCKLTTLERTSLAEAYSEDLTIYEIGKGLTRIEGCMHHMLYQSSFSYEYKLAVKRSKVSFAMLEVQQLQESYECHMDLDMGHALDAL